MNGSVVHVDGVCFRYERRRVLEDVELVVQPGQFLGLVGPNGGGKTTLLKLILGSLEPEQGKVTVFGQPASQRQHRRRIGYVPQHAAHVDPRFPATLAELVETGCYGRMGLIRRFGPAERQAVAEALDVTGLTELRSRLMGELSGGQQQRAFIARALAGRPQLLLLDEPTAGIDRDAQERFYELLRHLNRQLGITLVLISHDIAVVAQEVTHLACLNSRLIYHGEPQDFDWRHDLQNLYGDGVRHIAHTHG